MGGLQRFFYEKLTEVFLMTEPVPVGSKMDLPLAKAVVTALG